MYRFLRQPRWIAITLLVPVLIFLFLMLSQWQWHRHQARSVVNAEVATNSNQTPIPLEQLISPDSALAADAVWRTVIATGRYDESGQVLVRLKTLNSAAGFWVATPLVTPSGRVLVVNRGWIRATGNARISPIAPPPPTGPVEVTGILQPTESGPAAEPSDVPVGEVTGLDINRIGIAARAPVYPGYINLTSSTPAQAEGLTLIPLPPRDDGSHLSYTMQWIVFSIMVVVGWFILVRREAKWLRQEHDEKYDAQAADTEVRI